ncbi:MAG: HigA family addiction module antitoxin [Terracidiphilus sp.]|jgi:HTH-type transcriptional regulator/antitoxin HigA
MATTDATWIKHPGFYIKEELDERGWSQRDLAFILGVQEQAVNVIISGKRGISPDMARSLGDAFDVNPDLFANLQKEYEMAQAKQPKAGVSLLGKMHVNYPVREMVNRGWLVNAEADMINQQLARFFEVQNTSQIPYMAHASKKRSLYEEREIPPAQLAWLFRVRHIAKSISAPRYSEGKLREAVETMRGLTVAPEQTREIPRLLAECGVRFIIVEKLPNSKIDGVCFWLNEYSPVIGMSIQRDTIDNFWFVLRHEIEHVLRKHGRKEEMIDGDLQKSRDDETEPEAEKVANLAARDFCVVTEKFESFIIRKKPFYYERDVIAYSRLVNRHPGIVVGQMQRHLDNYSYLTPYLSKVKQFVVPGAIADGWGQILPISL